MIFKANACVTGGMVFAVPVNAEVRKILLYILFFHSLL
ncbi:conserved hypothetical protein [delta proteobacterium NaphS2]|nr:conserved hypothetical protein [delta proteobacterium NaphS2]